MVGISTACVAFVFVCIVFPKLVRNRPQFYAAVGSLALQIPAYTLAAIAGGGFATFLHFFVGLLVLVSFVMLILATGGLDLADWAGEMKGAFEVIRRGEEEKEVIIPRRNADAAVAQAAAERFETPPPPPPAKRDSGNIPLE